MSVAEQGRYPASERLLDDAVETTGLDDFGPGDFREGLDVLLESLRDDAGLSPSTDDAVIGGLHSRLVNRLLVEDWYRTHPEVEDVPITGPVHVIGLPRTGTTALGSMLSLDPQFRSLRMWEQRTPVPPPVMAGELEDPRRLAYVAEIDALSPEARAMHLYEVDATVEDSEVLGMAFHGQQYTLPVWGYHRWWRQSDLTDTFAYHRRVAKLLGSRRPPSRWLFKAPHHTFHLDHLVIGLPRRPLRVDPPRPDPFGAVVRQLRVVDLPHRRERARPHSGGSGGVEPPPRRPRAGRGGPGPHRRGPLLRRAPPRARRRPHGHRRPGL